MTRPFGMLQIGRVRLDLLFLLILMLAALARTHLLFTQPYIHDENNNAIALARTISLQPGSVNLPLRGENHGALPAYVVKASGELFGTTREGYRVLHVLLGLCAIVLVYLMTSRWYGPVAARWAGSLLAFNEYFLNVSSRATAHSPFLFLIAVALYAFSRFLASQRVALLYVAGAAVGLAFYCKEHAALLLPVFFLMLFHPKLRHWLKSPHAYLAAAIFVLVISPDLVRNLAARGETMVSYGDGTHTQARYSSHLERIGGLGFSLYPLMFYARQAVRPLYAAVNGTGLADATEEYQSINPALGLVLLAGVVATTLSPKRRDLMRMFLLLAFWCVFGLFSSIEPGDPPGRLDAVSWIWVETTMFASVMLTGALISDSGRWTRLMLSLAAAAALIYGVATLLIAVGP